MPRDCGISWIYSLTFLGKNIDNTIRCCVFKAKIRTYCYMYFIKFQVQCSDNNFSASTDVFVKIKDINDNTPEFSNKTYFLALKEVVFL